jgi:hypothetical protein
MLTMREMGPDGLAAKKNRDWNKPELLEKWREQWAVAANRALERAGREERIDHRSLAEQGLERMPQVHLGPHSAALERQGIQTEKGDHNRVVVEHNAVVIELEKLREEKRELELRKAVNDRYQERLGAGWRNEHAFALGQLEWLMGGKPLTQDDVNRVRQEQQDELRSIERQVDHLISEDHRLRRAEPIIINRDKAALEVDRLNAHASMEGVFSQADLRAQRAAWEEKWAQVPELDKRAEGIKGMLGRASLAVDGFCQEQARARERSEARGRALDDLAWERQRNRERDRGMDRGR